MRTDQIFSPLRFVRLCRKTLVEDRRSLLLTSLSLTAVYVAVALLIGLNDGEMWEYGIADPYIPLPIEAGWFTIIFFVWGMFVASATFKSLGRPGPALSTLTCPASQFESFLMRWLTAVPLFFVWAVVSAMIADGARILFTQYVMWCPAESLDWWNIICGRPGKLGLPHDMIWRALGVFIALQSLFFLGAVVWSRHNFFKTFATLLAIGIAYSTTGFLMYVSYFLEHETIPVGGLNFDSSAPLWIFITVVTLFNYVLAYMRFREAEIIHRW